MSIGDWLERNVMSKPAREMLDMVLGGTYTSTSAEVSLLWMLLQMSSAGGPTFVISGKGGSQDARPVGGMGAIYRPMVAALGDALHLSRPVRTIIQDTDGVTVQSDGFSVRAYRAIVAIPMAIADSIGYEPALPADRAFLNQRMPSGAVIKTSLIYDKPFWRADGLSGQSAAPGTAATLTIDACTDTGSPGIMCAITEGPAARRLTDLSESDRRAAIIGELIDRFGELARTPTEYHEQNWSLERYSGAG